MPDLTTRDFDIVLFGASGFTGKLVAEYLLQSAPSNVRWAIAGRNLDKLNQVKSSFIERFPQAQALAIIAADAGDHNSLTRLAHSCRVVITTVGPYGKYGEALVAACAEAGTSYCDLTGEVPFIRKMVDAYESLAQKSGARIVHCCGYDSIPSDLGCMMVGEALLAAGTQPISVELLVGKTKGGISGGTFASLLHILSEAKEDRNVRRLLGHPYSLNPVGDQNGPDGQDQRGARYVKELNSWSGPFVMAGINTRLVRRGLALRGHPYGRSFQYSEASLTGKGAKGYFQAVALSASLGAFVASLQVEPLKRWIESKWLPKAGEGPSQDIRDSGYFNNIIVGRGRRPDGQLITIRGHVKGTKDPGYGETAKMLGESALCLALQSDVLPVQGGSWTPASAMGDVLIKRLTTAGMSFYVEPQESKAKA